MTEPLRVCYFGTYRAEYSRNKIMIEGLRRSGVEVIECHETLWRGIEDRVQTASGGWRKPSFWSRVIGAYLRLIWRYLRTPVHDLVIVGYPGQFDVYLARLLSWLRGKPLVWDVFMSIYLIALERGLDQRSAFTINWIRRIERRALRLPNLLIHDTEPYVQWLCETHDLEPARFRLVPTGADDRIFQPAGQPRAADGQFQVIYYGTFTPNHGVQYIIEAARYLTDEADMRAKIQFDLIGDGPDRPEAESLVREYDLGNVNFVGWLEPEDLIQRAAQADLCLGAFGTTPQSIMTVQNKLYEGLAMARPVVSGEAAAVQQALKAGHEIYLCQRADGQSLAKAILALYRNPELRESLSREGHRAFVDKYSLAQIGARYRAHLLQIAAI
jgi:glycosyltransferase involved in cell wall biosynthesis